MANTITYRINVEEGPAFEAFRRMSQAERDIEIKTRKASLALKQQGRTARATGISFKQMIGAAAGIGGIAALVTKGTTALIAYDEALNQIAKRSGAAAKQMRSFFSVLAPIPGGTKFAEELLALGTAQGLKQEETAALAEPIVSAFNIGDLEILDDAEKEKIRKALGAALKAVFVQVSPELAGFVEVAGIQKGLAPGAATGFVVKASSASGFSKEDFAKAVPSLNAFQTMQAGLGTMVALSQGLTDPGRAPTLIRNVADFLGPTGGKEEIRKKRGLVDATPLEIITALRKEAVEEGDQSLPEKQRAIEQTARIFANSEKRLREGMIAVISNFESVGKMIDTLATIDPVAELHRVQTAVLDAPGQKAAFRAEINIAQAGLSERLGPIAEKAEINRINRLTTGQRLISAGLPTKEGGEAGFAGRSFVKAVDLSAGLMLLNLGLVAALQGQTEVAQRAFDLSDRLRIGPQSLEEALINNALALDVNTSALSDVISEIPDNDSSAINTEINTEAGE